MKGENSQLSDIVSLISMIGVAVSGCVSLFLFVQSKTGDSIDWLIICMIFGAVYGFVKLFDKG